MSDNSSTDVLAEQVLAGNKRSLARAISLVEDGGPQSLKLVKKLFPYSGSAHLVGVTGSPGVGKSTLVDALITEVRQSGIKVGVLAIDPSSPFTGGAILGDRIRMQEHTLDQDVFIRSMANRGQSGGIALATYDAVRMLEAFGCQFVIIETVGVGQAELAIAQAVDTTILVLMPGYGDDVQAIKSGIMEIGDIFVVNKGDLPGANKAQAEIMQSLELASFASAWRTPVIVTTAENGKGIDHVWQSIKDHKLFLSRSGLLAERRRTRIQSELAELVASMARANLNRSMQHSENVQQMLAHVLERKIDPHSAAEHLVQALFHNGHSQ